MELRGKKVLLRAVEESDCEMLRTLANDPEYEKMIIGWSWPVSKAQEHDWFMKAENGLSRLRYIIETEEDGAVGMIGLRNIDWKNGAASGLGMRIAKKEARGKGLATDAWMTLLRYAFEELRLNRIAVAVLSYNHASLRVFEKLGFKQEGIRRQAIYKNGVYNDTIVFGLLRSEYDEFVAKNDYWNS